MTRIAFVEVLEPLLIFVGTIIASSGFWMYMIKRLDARDQSRRLLVGLAHDRIMYLGMKYISRGYVRRDEYETLCTYLYEPYNKMGGNGAVKRIMEQIDNLPMKNVFDIKDMEKEKVADEDSNQ
jgi:hypothetical protein